MLMEAATIHALIAYWVPYGTAFGLTYKAWRTAKLGVSRWANKLLDNHFTHLNADIQILKENSEKQTQCLEKIASKLGS